MLPGASGFTLQKRLLLAVLTSKDSAAALRENATMDVVLKICWSVKHMLQAMPLDDAALSTLYGVMYKLYLRLSDQELDLAGKQTILAILCRLIMCPSSQGPHRRSAVAVA